MAGALGGALGGPRIHGRKKRQVLEMFAEEKPHLRPLPRDGMRYFRPEMRTVDDGGLCRWTVVGPAGEAPLYSDVIVRVYREEIEVLNRDGIVVRRHPRSTRKGHYEIPEADRIFNPSRETVRLLGKARKLGRHSGELAQQLFASLGRTGTEGHLRAHQPAAPLRRRRHRGGLRPRLAVSQHLVSDREEHLRTPSPEHRAGGDRCHETDPAIRPIDDYQRFWDEYSQSQPQEYTDAHVDERT